MVIRTALVEEVLLSEEAAQVSERENGDLYHFAAVQVLSNDQFANHFN